MVARSIERVEPVQLANARRLHITDHTIMSHTAPERLHRAADISLRGGERATLRIRGESARVAPRPLRYSINVSLDGCCDHQGIPADGETHSYWAANLERADALLFGRVTYEMMEQAWRQPATGTWPDWMDDSDIAFARTIDDAKKYIVSGTLDRVDWNAELVGGDLGNAVQELKRQPGRGLFVGGVTLPLALADLGLIDEYEFVVHPVVVGHGPTLLAGLGDRLRLTLVGRHEFKSGAVALRYQSPG